MTESGKNDKPAHYALEAEMLWPDLWRVLESVGHYWTFDARSEELLCKDCDWYAEGPFLEVATKARQHRDDVKEEVLRLALKTLRIDGSASVERPWLPAATVIDAETFDRLLTDE